MFVLAQKYCIFTSKDPFCQLHVKWLETPTWSQFQATRTMFPILFCAFLALIPILWLYSRWSEKETVRELARRNVSYVPQPNIFFSILKKERLEEPKHALIAKHGNVFGFRFLGEYTIHITEPDIIQQILSKEFATFTNRRVSYQIFYSQNCSKITFIFTF